MHAATRKPICRAEIMIRHCPAYGESFPIRLSLRPRRTAFIFASENRKAPPYKSPDCEADDNGERRSSSQDLPYGRAVNGQKFSIFNCQLSIIIPRPTRSPEPFARRDIPRENDFFKKTSLRQKQPQGKVLSDDVSRGKAPCSRPQIRVLTTSCDSPEANAASMTFMTRRISGWVTSWVVMPSMAAQKLR